MTDPHSVARLRCVHQPSYTSVRRRSSTKGNNNDHEGWWDAWRRFVAQVIRETILQQRYIGLPRSTVLLMSRHPYLPLSYVEEFKSIISWDMHSLSFHPDMTRGFRSKHISSGRHQHQYKRSSLSTHPYKRTIAHFQGQRTFSFIEFEKKPYHKTYLTYHPKLSIALVLKHPVIVGWDYRFLLLFREWTIPQLYHLLRLRRMDWKLYSQNPFLTTDIVHEFLKYPWDWSMLATSPCFPPQDIFQDPILMPRWKWRSVFKNPRMHVDFWKQLVTNFPRTVHDPLVILHNRFEYDPALQAWATFRIHRAIEGYRRRRRVRIMFAWLRTIEQHAPIDIVRHILSFI